MRTSIQEGELTAEHVPPASFGGEELLLTCKKCNDTAGAILDADAHRREHVENTSFGIAEIPLRARTVVAGHRLQGRVQQGAKGLEFKIDKANNNPAALAALAATPLKAGMVLDLDFAGERYSELGANISAGFVLHISRSWRSTATNSRSIRRMRSSGGKSRFRGQHGFEWASEVR